MFYYVVFATVAILTTVLNGKPTTSLKNEPERCCIPTQFSSQLIGMKGVSLSVPDQQKSSIWIIENMNDGQIYAIDEDAKKCYKSTMPIKPIHYIPDTATYRIQNDEAVDYVTVSRDGRCILLTDSIFFQNPALVDAMTTTDFVPQIDDPSIFDIPAECKNAI
ncbi:unnamed protein product [Rotaria sordida]|uniref:Uncharacterized protein n=1 Tax=Rotaria sordida TaxID=392033 RepID=A0A814Z7E8_9BILA|nr:unnamed protein product [Rotaria sordida]